MSPTPSIALATVSAHLTQVEPGFRLAADLGYDGVEVMVGYDRASRDADRLRELARRYGTPVLALHAPTLLLTSPVWGNDAGAKLERTVELAERVGASTVITHPPFAWQPRASRMVDLARGLEHRTGIVVAIENMYPWRLGGRGVEPYRPGWNTLASTAEHVTLDVSHAAAAGQDSLELALALGCRLAHVHLADGPSRAGRDRHLVPGSGDQPVDSLLRMLAERSWAGIVSVELAAHALRPRAARADAAAALAFARRHLAVPVELCA